MNILDKGLLNILILIFLALAFSSCRSVDCDDCKEPGNTIVEYKKGDIWNVELNDNSYIIYKYGSNEKFRSIETDVEPTVIATSDGNKLLIIEVNQYTENSFKEGDEIKYHEHLVPIETIKRITNLSNPLELPIDIIPSDECFCCERKRDGLWWFDKVELRGLFGYRKTGDGIFYPDQGVFYEKESFGTGVGGSDYTFGLEAAFLWDASNWFVFDKLTKDTRDKFHAGLMTGLWPVDGSLFIPLSFHLRYTFDNLDLPKYNDCDAWYIFADIGVPISLNGNPVYCFECEGKDNFDNKMAYFYDFGIGYDWWLTKDVDFSLDFVYRNMNLPLNPIICDGDDRYPFRNTHNFSLRFGLTY